MPPAGRRMTKYQALARWISELDNAAGRSEALSLPKWVPARTAGFGPRQIAARSAWRSLMRQPGAGAPPPPGTSRAGARCNRRRFAVLHPARARADRDAPAAPGSPVPASGIDGQGSFPEAAVGEPAGCGGRRSWAGHRRGAAYRGAKVGRAGEDEADAEPFHGTGAISCPGRSGPPATWPVRGRPVMGAPANWRCLFPRPPLWTGRGGAPCPSPGPAWSHRATSMGRCRWVNAVLVEVAM